MHAPLETAGPFARLKATAAAGTAATDKQQAEPAEQPAKVEQRPAAATAVTPPEPPVAEYSVETHGLTFIYPGLDGRPLPSAPAVVRDMSTRLRPGSRCLLVGPNGRQPTGCMFNFVLQAVHALFGCKVDCRRDVQVLGKHLCCASSRASTRCQSQRSTCWARRPSMQQSSRPAGRSPMWGGIGIVMLRSQATAFRCRCCFISRLLPSCPGGAGAAS